IPAPVTATPATQAPVAALPNVLASLRRLNAVGFLHTFVVGSHPCALEASSFCFVSAVNATATTRPPPPIVVSTAPPTRSPFPGSRSGRGAAGGGGGFTSGRGGFTSGGGGGGAAGRGSGGGVTSGGFVSRGGFASASSSRGTETEARWPSARSTTFS